MQLRRISSLVAVLFTLTAPIVVHAQATRTWVSGVGDDVNPCSRTAPCKTFAGAISKTAAHGEITVMDPGGYGPVTITKSITLSGEGTAASILSSGTNGIIVKAGADDIVTIRNISINGAGTGVDGIRYLSGKALIVDHVNISGFTGDGIKVQSSAGSSAALLTDVFIVDVTGAGVRADGAGVQVNINKANIAHNTTGLQTSNGGIARLSNVFFANNTTAIVNGGTVISFGDNRFAGNTTQQSGGAVQSAKQE